MARIFCLLLQIARVRACVTNAVCKMNEIHKIFLKTKQLSGSPTPCMDSLRVTVPTRQCARHDKSKPLQGFASTARRDDGAGQAGPLPLPSWSRPGRRCCCCCDPGAGQAAAAIRRRRIVCHPGPGRVQGEAADPDPAGGGLPISRGNDPARAAADAPCSSALTRVQISHARPFRPQKIFLSP